METRVPAHTMDAQQLPDSPRLEEFEEQAKELLAPSGSPEAVDRLGRFHPNFVKLPAAEIARRKISLAEARCVIAREHGFADWAKFQNHIQELGRRDSPVARFELAADAIVAGDLAGLNRLLKRGPELANARSTRLNESPLIHYVAANGVEDFRQKTPGNILAITQTLLRAGARVAATSQAYGGASTALGLAATSYHPAKASVQLELLEALLQAGACIDGAPGGWNPLVAALRNGRGDAAGFLASRGARLDLEGAAGTGQVDVVAGYLDAEGKLKAGATREQLSYGFIWACEFGHQNVVELLLRRGIKPDPDFMHGETVLHWAAFGGHAEIVNLLVEAKLSVNAIDRVHGGTPLGWAIYGWNDPAPDFKNARYHEVVERLVRAGATVDWKWIESPERGLFLAAGLRADARMMAALRQAQAPAK